MPRSNAIVEYLRENGPSPYSDLPYDIGFTDKVAGARKFDITSNTYGSTQSTGGSTTPVYYLDDHNPIAVVDTWVSHNKHVIDAKSGPGFIQSFDRTDPDFADAITTVARHHYDCISPNPGGGDPDPGGDCPYCADEYDQYLPQHLRDGCDAFD